MNDNYKVENTQFGNLTEHPSYGTLVFKRSYGGLKKTTLFGSSIEHQNTITMEVRHASLIRGSHRDVVFGENPIVTVEMSYAQFAEAITSFGQGSGIPVTLRYTERDGRIPECEFVDKRKQFTEEFKKHSSETMETSKELIKEVTELFSKKVLTKADKEGVLNKLKILDADIGVNVEVIVDRFNNQMDKTIMEAKSEVEAFCQNRVDSIANAALIKYNGEMLNLVNPINVEEEVIKK